MRIQVSRTKANLSLPWVRNLRLKAAFRNMHNIQKAQVTGDICIVQDCNKGLVNDFIQ